MEIKKIIITLTIIFLASIVGVRAECHQNLNGVWIDEHNNPCPPGSGGTTGPNDKVIATIDYCYNLTVDVNKKRSGGVPISFKGCTDKGEGLWSCNCKDTEEYDVVMVTDGAELNSEDYRLYGIELTYTVYDKIKKERINFDVKDWGDNFDITGKNTTHLGTNTITVEKVVQVNNTVYVDREVPKIEYVDRTNTVTVEDTTKIKALNESLTTCNIQVQQKKSGSNWLWAIILVLIGFIGYRYYKSKKG